MSIHVVTIDIEAVSASTGKIYTIVPLYGVANDDIVDAVAFQETINRLIAKHEALLGTEITEVQLVCNGLGLSVVRNSKIKALETNDKITYSNSFTMKTCKVHELYPFQSLKTAINTFTSIGINVVKVWSVLSLFLLNATQVIARQKIAFMVIGARKITVCNFDGAGSISSVMEFPKGLHDIVEYISSIVIAKFAHVKKETVVMILQNFIHFNEIEFIQKIHNTRYVKSTVMSSINYDAVQYTSSMLREYLCKVVESMKLGGGCTYFLHTQNEYVHNIVKIFSMVLSADVRPLSKEFTVVPTEEKKRTLAVKEMFGFLFNKK